MTEKLIIVIGDRTSHGGCVTSGSNVLDIENKLVACVGDKISCPVHGDGEIVEGFVAASLHSNKMLAYHGCKTSCGATLIAGGQTIMFVDLSA